MGIKEIISSIKALQAHALQDYLGIILRENSISLTDWRQQYASFVESQHEKNITNVAEIYKVISLNGIDTIDIKKLDTSAIINYIRFGKIAYKNKEEKKKTEWYLSLLQDDRNIDAHVNGNETNRELYQFAVIELAHLTDFVDYVWNAKKSEAAGERYEYTKEYKNKISQTLSELDLYYRKEILEENKSIKSRIRERIRLLIGVLLIGIGSYLILHYFQLILEKILNIVER